MDAAPLDRFGKAPASPRSIAANVLQSMAQNLDAGIVSEAENRLHEYASGLPLDDHSSALQRMASCLFSVMIGHSCWSHDWERGDWWLTKFADLGFAVECLNLSLFVRITIDVGDPDRAVGILELAQRLGCRLEEVNCRAEACESNRVVGDLVQILPRASARRWNTVIRSCCEHGDLAKAKFLVDVMESGRIIGFSSTVHTYNLILNLCAQQGNPRLAASWVDRLLRRGLAPTVVTYGTLCKAFSALGDVEGIKELIMLLEATAKGNGPLGANQYLYGALMGAVCARRSSMSTTTLEAADVGIAEWVARQMISNGLPLRKVAGHLGRVVGVKRTQRLLRHQFREARLAQRNGNGSVGESASGGGCSDWDEILEEDGPQPTAAASLVSDLLWRRVRTLSSSSAVSPTSATASIPNTYQEFSHESFDNDATGGSYDVGADNFDDLDQHGFMQFQEQPNVGNGFANGCANGSGNGYDWKAQLFGSRGNFGGNEPGHVNDDLCDSRENFCHGHFNDALCDSRDNFCHGGHGESSSTSGSIAHTAMLAPSSPPLPCARLFRSGGQKMIPTQDNLPNEKAFCPSSSYQPMLFAQDRQEQSGHGQGWRPLAV
eukprot:TRINITY_DN22425_c0_g2_i1.p1 TRINITY_DN22425_c0_g2~~TRINITY_DN22425_c0_g2_i1.p1  ORF type:complete len:605 (+),score=90.70 TRINITY_DN22425_c0_g2_i1:97-1911(+)